MNNPEYVRRNDSFFVSVPCMLRFKLLDRIYQSNSSIICMGEDRFCGHAVAIKIVTDRVKAVGELKMLKRMGHPNIVSVTDCFEDNHCVAIVMELMSMDLKVFMHTVAYSFSNMKEIMLQSMRGLHHMHTRDFIHMDLKPENIGVTWRKNSVRCCILDLGSAVTFSDLQIGDIIHTTREYTSPEMLRGIVTFAVDIFSMGRILNHLIDRLSTSSACCLNIMRTLSEDMTLKEHTDRPTSKAVLIRLDDDMTPLLCTARELVWNSIAGNLCDGDASRLVNDTSAHLHKMVSLIRCDSVEMVENGFWLLQEQARREVEGSQTGPSLVSVLPYFHQRIGVSPMAGYFYARTVERLSSMPYFVLADEIRSWLWTLAAYPACRSWALRALGNRISVGLLQWCAARQWGARKLHFTDFIADIINKGEESMCLEAAQRLRAIAV